MKFTVKHNGRNYVFDTADELYIFGLGIEIDVETKLQTNIIAFVDFIRQCHNEDCNNAPLKPFVAFIADWWKELRGRDKQFIVNNFYENRN